MKPEKVAPGLLVALQDMEETGETGLARHVRSLGVVLAPSTMKPPRTVVFLHCKEDAKLDYLAALDIRVNQPSGRVRTAFLPMERLGQLSEEPAVEKIVGARYLRPQMDLATKRVRLPAFRQATGLTGSGVVVGVVDTGIDPSHPEFEGRILRIWDQTLSGPGVPEGTYGLELQGADLTASRDTHGHGSHVAGIAAGDDPTFGGVAPEASLVIVKTDFQDAHIADGIRYVFRIARELGRPAVVNLSLGGHWDSHDGADSLSQIVDDESGPGRIICCAAGNEGDDPIHGQLTLAARGEATIRVMAPDGFGAFALNGWYAGNRRLEVSVISPNGFETRSQRPARRGTSPTRRYNLPDGQVSIVTPGPDPSNGDHQIFVQIQPRPLASNLSGTIWRLRVRNVGSGQARLDVWALGPADGPQPSILAPAVQDSMKIGSPGAAEQAITVAAYTTRDHWTDVDGIQRAVGLAVDDIASFSSEGPARDLSQKPDVAAPGAMIVSAASPDAPAKRPFMVDQRHVVNAGTSMACPFVAGLVALLLQREPTLTPAEAKARLRAASAIPGRAAGSFDPKWGFGLVDAEALAAALVPAPGGQPVAGGES